MLDERPELKGLRVLVVEDSFLLAEEIIERLQHWGCTVVGPAARVKPALALVRESALDGALLDVNLVGETSFPVAAVLRDGGVPFIFVTGYNTATILPEYAGTPILSKPIDFAAAARALAKHFLGVRNSNS